MWRWNPHQPPEDGLPPQEVRVVHLGGEPLADGRRVRVTLEITPFTEPPNLEVAITDDQEREVSSISIIQTVDSRMSFIMHLRGEAPAGGFTLTATISYPEAGTVHQEQARFEME